MKVQYLIFFILISCSFFVPQPSGTVSAKKLKLYSLSFNNKDWKKVSTDESDYLFQQIKSADILMANSFCQEFQSESLKKLAKRGFRDIEKVEIIKESEGNLYGRSTYEIEGSGFVDGIKVNLKLVNLRRDHCYFDFISISSNRNKSSLHADFLEFIQSVRFVDEK